MELLLFAAVALLLSTALTHWLQGRGVLILRALDHPGERSLHSVPTPRTGGVAIAMGMLPTLGFLVTRDDALARAITFGWLLVFIISLVDDLRTLPFWARLPLHAVAALAVMLAGDAYNGPYGLALGVFWIVWGTNLFNFMDGMDGLASSMAVVGGSALGAGLLMVGADRLALLPIAAAAAALGFLWFNWPTARIFMGDAGSASLGFVFASVSVAGVDDGNLPAWFPLVVFLPFVTDATFTLLRRIMLRRPIWQAHREHAYQRAVLHGWAVPKVLAYAIGLMLACAALALGALHEWRAGGWGLLAGLTALFVAAYSCMMRFLKPAGIQNQKLRGDGGDGREIR